MSEFSWSVYLQCWLKCCWDNVSSYFSAVLACVNFVFRSYTNPHCLLCYFFERAIPTSLYLTVNIIDKTCKQTTPDTCLPIPTGWLTTGGLNDSKSGEVDCFIWVTLSVWSINESPSHGWRHMVLGFWSSTPCSVCGGAVSWGIAPQVGRSWVRFLMVSLKIFRHNPSGRTMTLGLTEPQTEMFIRNISWA
jgi:hypothetical protein